MQNSRTLWIASGNAAKGKELLHFANLYLDDYDQVKLRAPQKLEETELTFSGNARLKAAALVQELLAEGLRDFSVLGDDSGVCVELLNGAPGIYSARFSGAGSNSIENTEKLLRELNAGTLDLNERQAFYHCASSKFVGGKMTTDSTVEGSRVGLIALSPRGSNGYAYDSVFLNPVTLLSYGELSYAEKQRDSHRSRAFLKLKQKLKDKVL